MEDIDSTIDSVLDEEIDLDEWTDSIDKQTAMIGFNIKSIPVNKKPEMRELYTQVYSAAASLLGTDTLDKMLTASLNSSSDIKNILSVKEDNLIIVKGGNVYSVQPLSQITDDSDEEIDGHNIGTITDCKDS